MLFIKFKKIFFGISLVLIIGSLFSLVKFPLKAGIDFSGGSLLEVKTPSSLDKNEVKKIFSELGVKEVEISQTKKNYYLLRFETVDEKKHQEILSKLKEKFPGVLQEKFESIGPSIGMEIRRKSFFAGILAIFSIALYVAFAFRKVSRIISSWKYGMIVVLTLFHDVLITLGFYALYSHFFGGVFDTKIVVALLTIMGYSVNDTIVVFDRVRENLRKMFGQKSFEEILNLSIIQTLPRSLNTSLTTLFVVLALAILGPKSIFPFTIIIVCGIIIGTYSSVCIATPSLTFFKKGNKSK